ncbi:MAG: hypothetical protein ISP71_06765 [Flavobacteriales bacterium]|nr:hypothetical protein [Flavobacteriales bacterium]
MKKLLFLATLLAFTQITYAQKGFGTNNPDPRSIIELQSTDKALYLPRLTMAQINAQSDWKAGMIVYNTDSNCVFFRSDAEWDCVGMDGDAWSVHKEDTVGLAIRHGDVQVFNEDSIASGEGKEVIPGFEALNTNSVSTYNSSIDFGGIITMFDKDVEEAANSFHCDKTPGSTADWGFGYKFTKAYHIVSTRFRAQGDDGNFYERTGGGKFKLYRGGTLVYTSDEIASADGVSKYTPNEFPDVIADEIRYIFEAGKTTNRGDYRFNACEWEIYVEEINPDVTIFFADVELNRVGIGTNTPTERLHVDGGVKITSMAVGLDEDEVVLVNSEGILRKSPRSETGDGDAWSVDKEDTTNIAQRYGDVSVLASLPIGSEGKIIPDFEAFSSSSFGYFNATHSNGAESTLFNGAIEGGTNSFHATRVQSSDPWGIEYTLSKNYYITKLRFRAQSDGTGYEHIGSARFRLYKYNELVYTSPVITSPTSASEWTTFDSINVEASHITYRFGVGNTTPGGDGVFNACEWEIMGVQSDDDAIDVFFADVSAKSVGIGTKTPSANLHVAGDAKITEMTTGSTSDEMVVVGSDGLLKKMNLSPWDLRGNASIADTNFLGTTDAQDLVFKSNDTERMRIYDGGDVQYFGQEASPTGTAQEIVTNDEAYNNANFGLYNATRQYGANSTLFNDATESGAGSFHLNRTTTDIDWGFGYTFNTKYYITSIRIQAQSSGTGSWNLRTGGGEFRLYKDGVHVYTSGTIAAASGPSAWTTADVPNVVADEVRYIFPDGVNTSNGDAVFNACEFEIEGQAYSETTDALFYGNAASGFVGIGTTTPTERLDVNGTVKASELNLTNLPVYADDAAAGTGGLSAGDVYRTTTGELRIKL